MLRSVVSALFGALGLCLILTTAVPAAVPTTVSTVDSIPAVVSRPTGTPPIRPAFDPGYIISDENFYDSASMTSSDVQRFLEHQKCTPVDGSPCLADYRADTPDKPAQLAHCARYRGARDQRASTIVVEVAHACDVSPMVLLVLMQKEQSLITRPSAYGYRRATGYGCPDTTGCEARYFGFFNQLYHAAWQFREYGASSGWRYHVGRVSVKYAPDASCGSSVVHIRNQATANLYNYTPYQPDAATLRRPDGPASACSAYGNLNFSRIFQRWFGSPTVDRVPGWWAPCLTFPSGIGCAASAPGGVPARS